MEVSFFLSFFLSFFFLSLSLYCHLQESSCAKGPWKYCSFYFIISGASMHVLFNLKIAHRFCHGLPDSQTLTKSVNIISQPFPHPASKVFDFFLVQKTSKEAFPGCVWFCVKIRAPGSTAYCNHTCLFLNITKEN